MIIEKPFQSYDGIVEANGFLFIGDPHVSSRKPGRRIDVNWGETVLKKLDFSIEIANERKLVIVILGDLFDQSVEEDEQLKTRLVRVLKKAWMIPITNTGNHDITHTSLSDDDTLSMLSVADVVDSVKTTVPVLKLQINEVDDNGEKNGKVKTFGLGMTPYGEEIPKDVRGVFDSDVVIWVTHHDIAFDGAYPGCVPPFQILGCDLVINGHVHKTKKQIKVGNTIWFNPGNITRQTLDTIDHVPCIFVKTSKPGLERIVVPHEQGVFDLTGTVVSPLKDDEEKNIESVFVSLLQSEEASQMEKSDDGSIIRDDIFRKFEKDGTRDGIKEIVLSLLSEVINSKRV